MNKSLHFTRFEILHFALSIVVDISAILVLYFARSFNQFQHIFFVKLTASLLCIISRLKMQEKRMKRKRSCFGCICQLIKKPSFRRLSQLVLEISLISITTANLIVDFLVLYFGPNCVDFDINVIQLRLIKENMHQFDALLTKT